VKLDRPADELLDVVEVGAEAEPVVDLAQADRATPWTSSAISMLVPPTWRTVRISTGRCRGCRS
jgi:hypothetical protein